MEGERGADRAVGGWDGEGAGFLRCSWVVQIGLEVVLVWISRDGGSNLSSGFTQHGMNGAYLTA